MNERMDGRMNEYSSYIIEAVIYAIYKIIKEHAVSTIYISQRRRGNLFANI
jgi:hypothetical protein